MAVRIEAACASWFRVTASVVRCARVAVALVGSGGVRVERTRLRECGGSCSWGYGRRRELVGRGKDVCRLMKTSDEVEAARPTLELFPTFTKARQPIKGATTAGPPRSVLDDSESTTRQMHTLPYPNQELVQAQLSIYRGSRPHHQNLSPPQTT